MKTVFRMVVCSDLHFKPDVETEPLRFERGLAQAYAYAEAQAYPSLDALFIVGDFANRGEAAEMRRLAEAFGRALRPETKPVLMLASHEFMGEGGQAGAEKRLREIFGQAPDQHHVMGGLHFISLSTENGCRILEEKQAWLRRELRAAAAEDPEKPIFVFQHPHLSDTVYGSINWGEDDIISILMDYPQVVDFSGHSHAPINDPRSAHQKFFSSFGTGSLSYFELDEFDFTDGTIPEDCEQCAQFYIVEVFDDNSVLVKPYDILSAHFFHDGYYISAPSRPETFTYTDARYHTAKAPLFPEQAKLCVSEEQAHEIKISFPQAQCGIERVDSYSLILRDAEGHVVRQLKKPSGYYLYRMPQTVSFTVPLEDGEYEAQVFAASFWKTVSAPLKTRFSVPPAPEASPDEANEEKKAEE